MESGLSLYDERNTVALRPAGKRNQQRRRDALDPEHPRELKTKIMQHESKVAMARVCRFCNRDQQGSRAICRFCRSCQYCGLVPTGSHACEFCGNRDLDRKPERRRVVVGQQRPRKRPDKPKRSVRRLEAQTRHRPEKTRLRG